MWCGAVRCESGDAHGAVSCCAVPRQIRREITFIQRLYVEILFKSTFCSMYARNFTDVPYVAFGSKPFFYGLFHIENFYF